MDRINQPVQTRAGRSDDGPLGLSCVFEPGTATLLCSAQCGASSERLVTQLDREADRIGGWLDSNWDTAKSLNGIDWPSGELFDDSFESEDTSAWSSTVP